MYNLSIGFFYLIANTGSLIILFIDGEKKCNTIRIKSHSEQKITCAYSCKMLVAALLSNFLAVKDRLFSLSSNDHFYLEDCDLKQVKNQITSVHTRSLK